MDELIKFLNKFEDRRDVYIYIHRIPKKEFDAYSKKYASRIQSFTLEETGRKFRAMNFKINEIVVNLFEDKER